MTPLNKPVTRRTNEIVDRRQIVVTLYPNGLLGLRLSGCRKAEMIPLTHCYYQAVKARISAEKT